MNLTEVQDQAIQARMALIVGAKTFDRLFAGIHFDELDGDILFVYAKDEETAAQVEDNFSLHIQIIAANILKREVNIVMVLPKQFVH
ncbi:hypothetical protein I6F35_28090 [Bradyrhizobium sp. BRP22]|nr:hypothetical protein [Bradyrhizobium sp. BRP22]MCA1457035.1 hypothetical protein [Bradyrhizobium sp. BRP22]